jgi:hypothetical protein
MTCTLSLLAGKDRDDVIYLSIYLLAGKDRVHIEIQRLTRARACPAGVCCTDRPVTLEVLEVLL